MGLVLVAEFRLTQIPLLPLDSEEPLTEAA